MTEVRTDSPPDGRATGFVLARELIVPAIMLGGAALYALDAADLSIEALLFPMVLGGVLVAMLAARFASLIFGRRPEASGEDEGAVLQLRSWLLVLLPLALVLAMGTVGAFAALMLLTIAAQFALGERSLVRSIAIAIAVTTPTYFLFKQILYVRFPAGVLGIG